MVGRADIFSDEQSIRDRENRDLALFGETQEEPEDLPSALGDETIPIESRRPMLVGPSLVVINTLFVISP
jgi:hypothetical protein